MRSESGGRGVALVTGGAVRIGRAITMRLAAAGYAIAIHGRPGRPEPQALSAEIAAAGGRAVPLFAELAEADAVAALMPAARAALGPVTLLVNNASEFHADEVGSLDAAQWDRHFAVNLRAPVFLAEALAANLPQDTGGAVVNLVDQRVLKPTPRFFSYGLTKSALATATHTLAQALAPRVRVNAVAPGPTLANLRQSAEHFAQQSAAVLLGRGPTPEEIAEAVAFLAEARSVTGQILAVDGGQHLAWRTPDAIGPE